MLVAVLQGAFAAVITLGPIAALIYLVWRDWRVERDRQANKRVRNYLTRSYR
jgi:hypothetical protein